MNHRLFSIIIFGSLWITSCGQLGVSGNKQQPILIEQADAATTALKEDTISVEKRYPRTEIHEKYDGLEKEMVAAGLVNVRHMDTNIIVELKYATSDNFLNSAVYGPMVDAYLRVEAAAKLSLAQDELAALKPGYRLIVFDAARPVHVQEMMWELVKDGPKRHYVANPEIGSLHNYGSAVDLSIVDSNGLLLDMGTPFDFFGKLAHPRHEQSFLKTRKLSRAQVQNRELLRKVMESADFAGIPTEWWHFNAFPLKHVETYFPLVP
ncbi:MAG: D-alanyl-D-alanine dipeptidase [Limisphaerales bacterium]|jgi:D-alanyl-D-alanine dipeptidase